MASVPPWKLLVFYWSQVWNPTRSKKRVAFMWSVGTRLLRWTSGEPASPLLPYRSNASFACPILVNMSNVSFGIASKLIKLDGGALASCMTFVVSAHAIKLETNHFGGKNFQEIHSLRKSWSMIRGITLWKIRVECNDWMFNKEQWHESKVKHHIWDKLIVYANAM